MFNKKNIISFILTISLLVVILNVIYSNLFVNIDNVNYGKSIKQLETQYYNYIQQRYGYNEKILETMFSLDPIIVIAANFFQVIIALLVLIWFHPFISREIESGIFGRNAVLMGRFKYLFVRILNSLVIIIPVILILQFLTIVINQNKFIPVNMDRQWPVIFHLLAANSFYFILVFILTAVISLFSKNKKKSLLWSIAFFFINNLILITPLKYLSPFFYRDWVFHKNIQVFYTQIFILFVFILIISAVSLFFYRRLTLIAKQDSLKW